MNGGKMLFALYATLITRSYPMRILITGSSGQIGTNLALRLQDAGTRCSAWTSG